MPVAQGRSSVPRQYTVNNKSYIRQTVLVCLAHGLPLYGIFHPRLQS